MGGAHGGSFERDDAAALEDTAEDGFGEVGVVQDASPELERLVGGEDHGATAAVALVDDMEETVGGVGSVGEVCDFVTDQELRTDVGGQGVAEAVVVSREREVFDQLVGG